jgi:hypothetical protein
MADVQVTCINKQPRDDPHEGITHLGGATWKWTRQQESTRSRPSPTPSSRSSAESVRTSASSTDRTANISAPMPTATGTITCSRSPSAARVGTLESPMLRFGAVAKKPKGGLPLMSMRRSKDDAIFVDNFCRV